MIIVCKMILIRFQDALRELLQRDTFYAPEVEIFRAVWKWAKANPECDIQGILQVVRLPLMSIEELLNVVRPANLVSPETILDAIQAKIQAKDSELRYRGLLCITHNNNNNNNFSHEF